MRKLGAELGVEAMTLYHYLPKIRWRVMPPGLIASWEVVASTLTSNICRPPNWVSIRLPTRSGR
ncbi:hypothetical protein [Nocardia sp. NBC_01388]|uniref:hypothetical protein n=1 Tax=Nocardia sp. NBC_01388 TaxID=2903596 RepID=UPI003254A03C